MITRSLCLRHGRVAIPKPLHPSTIRQWRRGLSMTSRRYAQVGLTRSEEVANLPKDKIVSDWEFFQHQRALTGKVGADVAPHYRPNDLIKNPTKPEDITLELLLASQTHLGHRTSLWNPANARYIFGTWGQAHDAIHVISLDITAAHLRRACKVISGVTAKGGLVLFVGTRDGHAIPVVRAAELAGGYHLFDKWIPGTLTNAQQILGKCKKKVVDERDETMLGFESQLPSLAAIKPDLVVCLNPLENYILLHECGTHNIPTIGIIDTDVNPTWVTYPIPANDDSLRSVTVIAGALGMAGKAGQEIRRIRAEKGIVDFEPAQHLRLPSIEEVEAAKRRKHSLSAEDIEEAEEILTPAEQALYEAAATPSPPKRRLIVEDPDETQSEAIESDEDLSSLTGFSDGSKSSSKSSSSELTDMMVSAADEESKIEDTIERQKAATPSYLRNEVVDDIAVSKPISRDAPSQEAAVDGIVVPQMGQDASISSVEASSISTNADNNTATPEVDTTK